jgi:antitoxin component YwqK of YwqJK toxin-antitoxin module
MIIVVLYPKYIEFLFNNFINKKWIMYFQNKDLLQNTLLPYFSEEEPLKSLNKQLYKLNYEKYNTHLQPHGIVENYYSYSSAQSPDYNGDKIKERTSYKNGKLDGLYQKWYYNGELWEKTNYKNGKLNGLWEQYDNEGRLSATGNCLNNLANGLYCRWWDNGQLKDRKIYKNLKLDGLYEEWYSSGKLKQR